MRMEGGTHPLRSVEEELRRDFVEIFINGFWSRRRRRRRRCWWNGVVLNSSSSSSVSGFSWRFRHVTNLVGSFDLFLLLELRMSMMIIIIIISLFSFSFSYATTSPFPSRLQYKLPRISMPQTQNHHYLSTYLSHQFFLFTNN